MILRPTAITIQVTSGGECPSRNIAVNLNENQWIVVWGKVEDILEKSGPHKANGGGNDAFERFQLDEKTSRRCTKSREILLGPLLDHR